VDKLMRGEKDCFQFDFGDLFKLEGLGLELAPTETAELHKRSEAIK